MEAFSAVAVASEAVAVAAHDRVAVFPAAEARPRETIPQGSADRVGNHAVGYYCAADYCAANVIRKSDPLRRGWLCDCRIGTDA